MSSSVGIRPIKIRFTSNINGQESLLSRNILQETSSSSSTPNESSLSTYPYFTDSVRFPVAKLLQNTKEERMDIFFNETSFRNIIGHVSNVELDTRNANAEYNVNALLKLLLPTTFPSINHIYDSFSENIKRVPTIAPVVGDSGFFATFTKLFSKGKGQYSYLQLNNTTYTITKITLLNDIINDKAFLPIIRSGASFIAWRKSTLDALQETLRKLEDNMKQLIETKMPEIQRLLVDQNTDAYVAYKKTKNQGIPQNNLAYVPSYLMVEFLDQLVRIDVKNDSHTKDIMNIFSEIYNLKSRAQRSNYIPYAIEKMDGFSDLLSRSSEMKVKTELHKLLSEMTDIFKLIDPKNKEDAKLYIGTKRKVFDEVQRYDKIPGLLNIADKYNKNSRHYSNPLLTDVFNSSKTNPVDFLAFLKFVNALSIEGYAPPSELFQQRSMIEKLRTGVMTVFDKSKQDDLTMEISAFYDILINIEVIEGAVNDENINDITCSFKDREYSDEYNRLKYAEKKNPVLFYNSNTPFVMAKGKKSTTSTKSRKNTRKPRNTTEKKRGGFPSQRPVVIESTKKHIRRSRRSKNSTPMLSLR